jgi:hypothetical protein
MPAKSQAQRRLMAIALHHPDLLKGKNRGVLKMDKSDMEDFASTKEKGLKGHMMTMMKQGKVKSKKKKL